MEPVLEDHVHLVSILSKIHSIYISLQAEAIDENRVHMKLLMLLHSEASLTAS